VAETPDDFSRWLSAQRQSAPEARGESERRGREVFLGAQCALCHSIGGTEAFGRTAPDLTHIASRRSLAAGTLPNTRGHLAAWILDPQSVKPGNKMPPTSLDSRDLQDLLDYLEALR
jgi:cytochrome c oxidase subunit 2